MQGMVNWNRVWQSIADTWIPLVVSAGAILIGLVLFRIFRKKKR